MRARKFFLIFAAALVLSSLAWAQEHPRTPRRYDFELSDIARRITPVLSCNRYMHADGWIWKEGRSSALVEKGKPADFYERLTMKIFMVRMCVQRGSRGLKMTESANG